ncbi:MAG TPA: fumarate reductase/succinate dehydrogenase flavoprotein subunit, partial [Gammaproteobacteria bacterium]|nr:fumarate reductase/succinate dehydrogenase flavoprotein subunit [Gammaproteobacteria bacterium]
IASRAVKLICDEGRGVGHEIDGQRLGVYLDFSQAIAEQGQAAINEKYGNLFEMYQRITNEDPNITPMRIFPAVHYTMGGLWVDYNLMTTIKGLFAAGEANFSDHGANRLGASALMQGLADGYFIIPATVPDYLAGKEPIDQERTYTEAEETLKACQQRIYRLMHAPNPTHSPEYYHRRLGKVIWNACGMARSRSQLEQAIDEIVALRDEFWQKVKVSGEDNNVNQTLERAGRVADFLELAELMCIDALTREESCGCHARSEHITADGEAQRHDDAFSYVAAWQYSGNTSMPNLFKEILNFEFVRPNMRNYR